MKRIFSAFLIVTASISGSVDSRADGVSADWNALVSKAQYNVSQLRAYALEGDHSCDQVDCNAVGEGMVEIGIVPGTIGLASARSGSSLMSISGLMAGGSMVLWGTILMTFYPDRADAETPAQYYETKTGFAKFLAMPATEQNDFIAHHLDFANWINSQHFELLPKVRSNVAASADPRISERKTPGEDVASLSSSAVNAPEQSNGKSAQ
ncbi:MAG: hypothetical protein P4M08_02050 [Oligoflexia bacterium]|nr:hypothetical protein [Oligoflexia bacterium]